MPDLLDPMIRPTYGSNDEEEWDALVLMSDAGIAQVRGVRAVPRWIVNYVWKKKPAAELATLETFFRAQKGPQLAFYAYTADLWRWWADVAAGTGNGSNLLFPFPGRHSETGTEIVQVDGVTKTAGVDYGLEFPTDSLKRGRVTFMAGHAPANGKAVTISFRGQRLLLGRLLGNPRADIAGYRRIGVSAQFSGEEQ